MGAIRQIYEHFELDLSDPAKAGMEAHLAANPRGKHGAHEYDLDRYGLTKRLAAVHGCRSIGKRDMKLNDALPVISVDPETYVVTADGEELTAAAAEVLAGLEAGKNVYVEWPLGITTVQAQELAALAKEKGVRTGIGLQARRSAEFLHIKKLIADGYVGDVLSVDMTQFSSGALARPSGRIWMRDKAAGANVLTITFGHAIDLLMTAVGRFDTLSAMVTTQVHEWTATDTGEKFSADAPDDIRVIGRLKSGAAVSVHVGSSGTATTGHRFVVAGTKGALVVTAAASPHVSPSVLSGQQGDDELKPIDVPQSDWVNANGLKGGSVNIGKLWASFARSIQDDERDFTPDFEAAVEHHQFVDAVQRASDTGQVQQL